MKISVRNVFIEENFITSLDDKKELEFHIEEAITIVVGR